MSQLTDTRGVSGLYPSKHLSCTLLQYG